MRRVRSSAVSARISGDGARADNPCGVFLSAAATRDFLAGRGLQRATFDLNAALEEVITLSRTEQRRARTVTRLTLDPFLPLVDADHIHIQQVILNLVLNAIDAMSRSRGGPQNLTIATSRLDADWAQVSVSEPGPGLELVAAPHLFEQFFTTKAQGTGGGLSISRSLKEAHSGRI